jgi:hypothetical protein
MKLLLEASALALALSLLPGVGHPQEKELTSQQQRMKSCNADAKDKQLKGEERQHFMSSCLKGEGGKELTAQQEKMKSCNREARDKELKGEDRQHFMSQCLKS